MSSKRSTRWSILPAIGINGYIDYKIIQGSFNTEKFNFFVRLLLRKINLFPRPRLILILNNINNHLSKDLTTIPCVTEYPSFVTFPNPEIFLAFYKSARI